MIQGGWDQGIGQQRMMGQRQQRSQQPVQAGVIGGADGYNREQDPTRQNVQGWGGRPPKGPMPVRPNPLQPEYPTPQPVTPPQPTPQPMQAMVQPQVQPTPDAYAGMTQGEPMQSNLVGMNDPRLLEELRRQQMLAMSSGY